MKDIENRQDLEMLLGEFYNRLLKDPVIGYVFTDVAKINIEEHLPVITDFWEQVLFHTRTYKNNPMQIHQALNEKEKLTAEHFDAWLSHFTETTDSYFSGPNAEKIKTRALSIATIIKIKVSAH